VNSVLTSLIAYVAAASLLIITPGLDTALVLRTAAGGSPRRAALAAIGIVTGCLVWTLVVALGLGAQARPGNSGKLLNTTNDLLRNQLIRIGRPRMVNV
jgi:threonine/homoserine/homoserine lactone efflux protein